MAGVILLAAGTKGAEPRDRTMTAFRCAMAVGADWSAGVGACADRLGAMPPEINVGFVYVAEAFADSLDLIARGLRARTGVPFWVGTAGAGVCTTGEERMAEPAIAVMACHLPEDGFALLDGLKGSEGELAEDVAAWAAHQPATFAVVHADPREPDLPGRLGRLAARTKGFLVGGLGTVAAPAVQVAGDATAGGISGILIGAEVPVLTGLTQGCHPIGPFRRITEATGPLVAELDGEPALETLIADLAGQDIERVLPLLHAAIAVEGSDRGDYLVRNLVGLDPGTGTIAVGAELSEGQRLAFVRRDAAAAERDLERLLDDLDRRLAGRPVQGALYHSCVARGVHLFGPGSRELCMIRERLGAFPLVGLFANGEIFHDRLYGYTGVLTLFL